MTERFSKTVPASPSVECCTLSSVSGGEVCGHRGIRFGQAPRQISSPGVGFTGADEVSVSHYR